MPEGDLSFTNLDLAEAAHAFADGKLKSKFQSHFDNVPEGTLYARKVTWGVMTYHKDTMKSKTLKQESMTPKSEGSGWKTETAAFSSPSTPTPTYSAFNSTIDGSRAPRRFKSNTITSDFNPAIVSKFNLDWS